MTTARLLLFLIAVQAGSGPDQVRASAFTYRSTDLPSAGAPPVQGTIRGTVVLPRARQRRVADRYAGGGAAAAHRVQDIPAVAFLKGPVPGHPVSPPAQSPEMAQRDTAFFPSLLVIPPGTTVSFPNLDPFFHNVFSYSSAQRFDLGRYPQGEAKEVRFDEPGIVKVYCEVHESMRSAIVVLENPFHAVVAGDGSFELAEVPPGEYTLVVWHADHEVVETPITVSEGGVTSLTEWGPFYEEYTAEVPTLVLNGMIFSLCGVYDFLRVFPKNALAKRLFDEGIQTLVAILPEYDLGFWSRYNLCRVDWYPAVDPATVNYQRLHVVQLGLLYALTRRDIFRDYADRFREQDTFRNMIRMYRVKYSALKRLDRV